jgi:hypothetical protein
MATKVPLQDHEQQGVPNVSPLMFCCCRLIDSKLPPDDHLPDCELLVLNQDIDRVVIEVSEEVDNNAGTSEPPAVVQRRKHRETVARLRQKMRNSIALLKDEVGRLDHELRCSVTSTNAEPMTESDNASRLLRRAYVELVREQFQLQDERDQLETTRSLREKYERLAHRELDKARTFRMNT